MTDAQRIYRSVLDFIDQQTEGLPPEIGLKMVRSYCNILAEPDEEVLFVYPGCYPKCYDHGCTCKQLGAA